MVTREQLDKLNNLQVLSLALCGHKKEVDR